MPQQQITAAFSFPAPVSDEASMQELANYIHQAMAAIEEQQDNPGFVPAGHRVRSASGLMHRSGHGAEHDRRVLFELYKKLQFIEVGHSVLQRCIGFLLGIPMILVGSSFRKGTPLLRGPFATYERRHEKPSHRRLP